VREQRLDAQKQPPTSQNLADFFLRPCSETTVVQGVHLYRRVALDTVLLLLLLVAAVPRALFWQAGYRLRTLIHKKYTLLPTLLARS